MSNIGHNNPPKVDWLRAALTKLFFTDDPKIKAIPPGDKCFIMVNAAGMGYDRDSDGHSASFIAKALGEKIQTTEKRAARVKKLDWMNVESGVGRTPNAYQIIYTAAEIEALEASALEAMKSNADVRSTRHMEGTTELSAPPYGGGYDAAPPHTEGTSGLSRQFEPKSEPSEPVVPPLQDRSAPPDGGGTNLTKDHHHQELLVPLDESNVVSLHGGHHPDNPADETAPKPALAYSQDELRIARLYGAFCGEEHCERYSALYVDITEKARDEALGAMDMDVMNYGAGTVVDAIETTIRCATGEGGKRSSYYGQVLKSIKRKNNNAAIPYEPPKEPEKGKTFYRGTGPNSDLGGYDTLLGRKPIENS